MTNQHLAASVAFSYRFCPLRLRPGSGPVASCGSKSRGALGSIRICCPSPPLRLSLAKILTMAAICSAVAVPCQKAAFGRGLKGLKPSATRGTPAAARVVRVRASQPKQQVITPLNGDPFIGMLETPVTSAPIVAGYLSSLPAYRTGVAPVLRGVEIGLAHGFLLAGPFIKLGPLRDTDAGIVAGCLSAAGLVAILTVCLSIYGAATFQVRPPSTPCTHGDLLFTPSVS